MQHVHACHFFPLRNADRLRATWCKVDVGVDSDGTISWESLHSQVSNHSCFSVPSSELDLIIYNVSEHNSLRRLLESESPINLDRIKGEATMISSSDTLPTSSCKFFVAVDICSSITPLPTFRSVSQLQIPVSLRPTSTGEAPETLNADDLMRHILIRISTFPRISREDCKINNIATTPELSHPEWVQSFIEQMLRQREISTLEFQCLLQHVGRLDDPSLTRLISNRLVCRDNEPSITTTGQNKNSRTLEFAGYLNATVPCSSSWTETQFSDMFKSVFWGMQTRTNIGNGPHRLTTHRNQDSFLEGLSIPVVTSDQGTRFYALKPDLAFFRALEPYLLVEVESNKTDYTRMLLYGASLVRWITRVSQHRFILPLIYVYKTGMAELSYMYEYDEEENENDDDNDNKNGVDVELRTNRIRYFRKSYYLNSLATRLDLLITIFNIMDREPVPNLYDTLKDQIAKLDGLGFPKGGLSTVSEKSASDNHSTIGSSSFNLRSTNEDVDMVGTRIGQDRDEEGKEGDDSEDEDEGPPKKKRRHNSGGPPRGGDGGRGGGGGGRGGGGGKGGKGGKGGGGGKGGKKGGGGGKGGKKGGGGGKGGKGGGGGGGGRGGNDGRGDAGARGRSAPKRGAGGTARAGGKRGAGGARAGSRRGARRAGTGVVTRSLQDGDC